MALTKAANRMIRGAEVNVLDFGAVGDGTTDDTVAFKAAINAADGALVYVPIGHYRITSPLNVGITATAIRISGENPVFHTHDVINPSYNNSSDFSSAGILNLSDKVAEHSVIQCDGCNLFGVDDADPNAATTTGALGSSDVVKYFANFFVYGKNDAEFGVYLQPTDLLMENCTFTLFKKFGIILRPGITSKWYQIAFWDNGWGLANSGSISSYPTASTYYSGCQLKILGSASATDFYTVTNGERPTTYGLTTVVT
jgi:hypothetical protein